MGLLEVVLVVSGVVLAVLAVGGPLLPTSASTRPGAGEWRFEPAPPPSSTAAAPPGAHERGRGSPEPAP